MTHAPASFQGRSLHAGAHPAVWWLGASVLVFVPLLSYANGMGMAVNITATAVLAGLLVWAIHPAWWHWQTAGRWDPSTVALWAFMVYGGARLLLAPLQVAALPPVYLLHSLTLVVLCPLAAMLGAIVGERITLDQARSLLWTGLVMALLFIALRLVRPEVISTDEIGKGSYYQYSGDCLGLAALLAYAKGYRPRWGWTYLLVLPVLLMLGSRASLAAFAVAMMASRFALIFVLAGGGLGLLVFLLADTLVELVPNFYDLSRILTSVAIALIEGGEDASLGERRDFHDQAVATILDHALLGRYGYDVEVNGFVGGHAHSALDLWAQYGLPALVAFILLGVGNPLVLLLRRLAGNASPVPNFMPLMLMLAMEFIFFRHPESVPLFFGLGLLIGVTRPFVRG